MPYMYVLYPGLKFYIERPESDLKALKMTINAQKDPWYYQYKALMSYRISLFPVQASALLQEASYLQESVKFITI